MFWFLYVIFSIIACHLIAVNWKDKYLHIMTILLLLMLTPTQIELASTGLAPSIFTFIYNVILERDLSLRALRPLAISLPLGVLILFTFLFLKNKFFQK